MNYEQSKVLYDNLRRKSGVIPDERVFTGVLDSNVVRSEIEKIRANSGVLFDFEQLGSRVEFRKEEDGIESLLKLDYLVLNDVLKKRNFQGSVFVGGGENSRGRVIDAGLLNAFVSSSSPYSLVATRIDKFEDVEFSSKKRFVLVPGLSQKNLEKYVVPFEERESGFYLPRKNCVERFLFGDFKKVQPIIMENYNFD